MSHDFKDNALLDPPVNLDATTDNPSNYLICQRSGFRVSVEEGLMQTWDGLWVRKEDWEPRHPQDFVRSRPETNQRGSVSPEQPDSFIRHGETVYAESTEDGSGHPEDPILDEATGQPVTTEFVPNPQTTALD